MNMTNTTKILSTLVYAYLNFVHFKQLLILDCPGSQEIDKNGQAIHVQSKIVASKVRKCTCQLWLQATLYCTLNLEVPVHRIALFEIQFTLGTRTHIHGR